jgi:UDP-N-acetylglucosamine transferase subunit ALG13
MIFVTVGSDIPFDRLIRAVDRWAYLRGRRDVFAQIGKGGCEPEFIKFTHMLSPREFRQKLTDSSFVIAHAGMGTILSALQSCKPILVMPRRGPLGETRNDHQMATAEQLLAVGKINVAFDDHELEGCLDRLAEFRPQEVIEPFASPQLVGALYAFIHHERST